MRIEIKYLKSLSTASSVIRAYLGRGNIAEAPGGRNVIVSQLSDESAALRSFDHDDAEADYDRRNRAFQRPGRRTERDSAEQPDDHRGPGAAVDSNHRLFAAGDAEPVDRIDPGATEHASR
jgi:hypothetical protein